MRLRAAATTFAALATALFCVPGASATSVLLGTPEPHKTNSYFECMGEDFGCPVGFTVAQIHPSGSNVAPAAGVITSWSAWGERISLRVLEKAPEGGWHGAGESAPATNSTGGPNATDVPIEAGDLIGVDIPDGSSLYTEEKVPGYEIYRWNNVVSETTGSNPTYQEPYQLELNAEVELTPIVSSVTPSSGSTAGGNTVTIVGKYLDTAVNVAFGGAPATTFTVDPSGERITAIAPSEAASTVDVHVSNQHSISETVAPDKYTFIAPPAPPSFALAGQSGEGAGPGAGARKLVANGFSESVARWRPGSALPHLPGARVGTTFAFALNEPASVALRFARELSGRRVGGKCVAPSHRNLHKPSCKRSVPVASLGIAGHAGANSVRFQGRLPNSKKLQPGVYSVILVTAGTGAQNALTHPLRFTILP